MAFFLEETLNRVHALDCEGGIVYITQLVVESMFWDVSKSELIGNRN